jgi:phosphatidylserine decarboxylase
MGLAGRDFRLSSFTVTPQGVELHKGEELGMFQMGSTIALIFECPQDYTVVAKEGARVRLGESLVAQAPQSQELKSE